MGEKLKAFSFYPIRKWKKYSKTTSFVLIPFLINRKELSLKKETREAE